MKPTELTATIAPLYVTISESAVTADAVDAIRLFFSDRGLHISDLRPSEKHYIVHLSNAAHVSNKACTKSYIHIYILLMFLLSLNMPSESNKLPVKSQSACLITLDTNLTD